MSYTAGYPVFRYRDEAGEFEKSDFWLPPEYGDLCIPEYNYAEWDGTQWSLVNPTVTIGTKFVDGTENVIDDYYPLKGTFRYVVDMDYLIMTTCPVTPPANFCYNINSLILKAEATRFGLYVNGGKFKTRYFPDYDPRRWIPSADYSTARLEPKYDPYGAFGNVKVYLRRKDDHTSQKLMHDFSLRPTRVSSDYDAKYINTFQQGFLSRYGWIPSAEETWPNAYGRRVPTTHFLHEINYIRQHFNYGSIVHEEPPGFNVEFVFEISVETGTYFYHNYVDPRHPTTNPIGSGIGIRDTLFPYTLEAHTSIKCSLELSRFIRSDYQYGSIGACYERGVPDFSGWPYDVFGGNWVETKVIKISPNFNVFNWVPDALTPTPTSTSTLTPTPTRTPTQTPTISVTRTATRTLTPTTTLTRTSTGTPAPTKTVTPTRTPTKTSTPTRTPTKTSTPTNTITRTSTRTPTPTRTSTKTPTSSVTASRPPRQSQTPTCSITPTRTPTQTSTPTSSSSPTPTQTSTQSSTPTPTHSLSPTPTQTSTQTPTPTQTSTPTSTLATTPTPTSTPTITNTPTRTTTSTSTPTKTSTPTNTPTCTITSTASPASTLTPTSTPTCTLTKTPTSSLTPTQTSTPTLTPTRTLTPTSTLTPTLSRTPRSTNTPTSTLTPTKTRSATPTPTKTSTPTRTPTKTSTPTITPTKTSTPTITTTKTSTPTITPSNTFKSTPTPTLTPTRTPRVTNTPSNTLTRTATLTRTITVTPTITVSSGSGPFKGNDARSIEFDSAGSLFLGLRNKIIHVSIDPTTNKRAGVVTDWAGTAVPGYVDASILKDSRLSDFIASITLDKSRNILYFADLNNHAMRLVRPGSNNTLNQVETLAGDGTSGTGDGCSNINTQFKLLAGSVFTDSTNSNLRDRADGPRLYISDGGRICKINIATRCKTTVAGSAANLGYIDDIGASARFRHVYTMCISPDELDLYIVEPLLHCVRCISLRDSDYGRTTTIAGASKLSPIGDRIGIDGETDGSGGFASVAKFSFPHGIDVDASGNIYVASWDRVRMIAPNAARTVSTIAGGSGIGWVDGIRSSAQFVYLLGLKLNPAQTHLYGIDGTGPSSRIRIIEIATGEVTTL